MKTDLIKKIKANRKAIRVNEKANKIAHDYLDARVEVLELWIEKRINRRFDGLAKQLKDIEGKINEQFA